MRYKLTNSLDLDIMGVEGQVKDLHNPSLNRYWYWGPNDAPKGQKAWHEFTPKSEAQISRERMNATNEFCDMAQKVVAGSALAIVATPLVVAAAPAVTAEAALVIEFGAPAVNTLCQGGKLGVQMLTASKVGGAFADATTQMVENKGDFSKYNATSTLLELNPFSNPITSGLIQGYGAEMLKMQGFNYVGYGSEEFNGHNAFINGSFNAAGNFLGDYPGGQLEQFNLGPGFDFMNSMMFNAAGNVSSNYGANQVLPEKSETEKPN